MPSENETLRTSVQVPDSSAAPTVSVEVSIRTVDIMPTVAVVPLSSDKRSKSALSSSHSSISSSIVMKKEQVSRPPRADAAKKTGRRSGKRGRRRLSLPISNCNFCSDALDEPIAPDTLKDSNKFYPATCPACEDKFFSLGLHVKLTHGFREKTFRCGMCSTPHSSLSGGMKHLRVHAKNKSYKLKATEDFYVVKVLTKSGGQRATRPSPQMKSEPPGNLNTNNNASTHNHDLTAVTANATAASPPTSTNFTANTTNADPHEATGDSGTEFAEGETTGGYKQQRKEAETEEHFTCQQPNCGQRFRCERSLRNHSNAHMLNIRALWTKKGSI